MCLARCVHCMCPTTCASACTCAQQHVGVVGCSVHAMHMCTFCTCSCVCMPAQSASPPRTHLSPLPCQLAQGRLGPSQAQARKGSRPQDADRPGRRAHLPTVLWPASCPTPANSAAGGLRASPWQAESSVRTACPPKALTGGGWSGHAVEGWRQHGVADLALHLAAVKVEEQALAAATRQEACA